MESLDRKTRAVTKWSLKGLRANYAMATKKIAGFEGSLHVSYLNTIVPIARNHKRFSTFRGFALTSTPFRSSIPETAAERSHSVQMADACRREG